LVDVVNDHAPPTLALVSRPEGHVSGTVPLVATASDDVGVVSASSGRRHHRRPDRDGCAYEVVVELGDVANGSHTIGALARDAAVTETLASIS